MKRDSQKSTLTDLLRQGIAASPSLLGLEHATGIKRQSLATFLRGDSMPRLDTVEKLMEHFGIEARRVRKDKISVQRISVKARMAKQ